MAKLTNLEINFKLDNFGINKFWKFQNLSFCKFEIFKF